MSYPVEVRIGRTIAAFAALWVGLAALACAESEAPEPAAPPDVLLSIEGVGEIPMFLNPRDRVVTPAIREQRVWEPTETHWFVRSIREGDVVVDVGANVGYYTLIAARLVGDTGRVYAFEPDPVSFALLERNVRLNGFTNVVLEQKAASNEAGSLRLYIAPHNKGDHRIFQVPGEDRDFVEVEAVALDDYFGTRAAEIDFIKIDTQGAEMAILQGMEAILRANEDLVMAVEYWPKGLHEFGVEPLGLIDLLSASDFRFFDLNAPLAVEPPEMDRTKLQQLYKVRNKRFTNLLTVRSRVAALGPAAPGFPRPN